MGFARSFSTFVARRYLTADPRSLAAGRIALAMVLLADLIRRVPDMAVWYTDDGLLPTGAVAGRPPLQWALSFFFMASHTSEAAIGFVACAIAYSMLLFGVRTRLAQILSLLCVLSLHGRVLFVQGSGDVVLVQLCLWTLFLPLGRRYSYDSLRARLRAFQEKAAGDLAQRASTQPDGRRVVSLAVFALTAQLAVICLFNALEQSGPTWRQGTALHYMVHADGVVTAFGAWLRAHLSPPVGHVLTWGAWTAEALLPILLLSPVGQHACRLTAVATTLVLLVGFALVVNCGIFVPAMIAFTPFLLLPRHWSSLEEWWRRRTPRRLIVFDGGCGVCFQIARVLARLDPTVRWQFIDGEAAVRGELPPETSNLRLSAETVQQTIVVIDPASGRMWLRTAAFAELIRALPLGELVAWTLTLPGLRALADAGYDAFARRRARISVALGLAACGLPTQPRPPGSRADTSPQSSVPSADDSGRRPVVRELLAGALAVIATVQVMVDHPTVTGIDNWRPSQWITAIAAGLQMEQRWALYAPDVPGTDLNVTVDALTSDDRHVDPLNQVASPLHPQPGLAIPSRLGQSALFAAYVHRIQQSDAYHRAFLDWMLHYADRTGRSEDRIVSLRAFVVEDDSPPPGEQQPSQTRWRTFLQAPPH